MQSVLKMSPQRVVGIVAALAAALVAGTCAAQQAAPPLPAPDVPQQTIPPVPPTKERGATLFAESGCTQCHGPQGNGTDKAPSIHDVRKRKTDDQIYVQIKEGKGAMPAFGDALSEDEIRSIVAFLRASDGWVLLPAVPPVK